MTMNIEDYYTGMKRHTQGFIKLLQVSAEICHAKMLLCHDEEELLRIIITDIEEISPLMDMMKDVYQEKRQKLEEIFKLELSRLSKEEK